LGFKQKELAAILYMNAIFFLKQLKRKNMNTKFTILIAAGLLFAGVTQAQNLAFNNKDIRNDRHEMVRDHRQMMLDRHQTVRDHQEVRKDRHEVRHDRHELRHDRRVIRHHHKVVRHHRHK
jgi:hypothetical protein